MTIDTNDGSKTEPFSNYCVEIRSSPSPVILVKWSLNLSKPFILRISIKNLQFIYFETVRGLLKKY